MFFLIIQLSKRIKINNDSVEIKNKILHVFIVFVQAKSVSVDLH